MCVPQQVDTGFSPLAMFCTPHLGHVQQALISSSLAYADTGAQQVVFLVILVFQFSSALLLLLVKSTNRQSSETQK